MMNIYGRPHMQWICQPPKYYGKRFRSSRDVYQEAVMQPIVFVVTLPGSQHGYDVSIVVHLIREEDRKLHQYRLDGVNCTNGVRILKLSTYGAAADTIFQISLKGLRIKPVTDKCALQELIERKAYVRRQIGASSFEFSYLNCSDQDIKNFLSSTQKKEYKNKVCFLIECFVEEKPKTLIVPPLTLLSASVTGGKPPKGTEPVSDKKCLLPLKHNGERDVLVYALQSHAEERNTNMAKEIPQECHQMCHASDKVDEEVVGPRPCTATKYDEHCHYQVCHQMCYTSEKVDEEVVGLRPCTATKYDEHCHYQVGKLKTSCPIDRFFIQHTERDSLVELEQRVIKSFEDWETDMEIMDSILTNLSHAEVMDFCDVETVENTLSNVRQDERLPTCDDDLFELLKFNAL